MSEWIKIDNKKPDDWQKCIVADIGHGEVYSSASAIYIRDGFVIEDSGLEASNFDGGASIHLSMDITHWFPLPEPPVE
ncbi:MAG: DUF551 domain-containing protein [Acinetobacter sp.]